MHRPEQGWLGGSLALSLLLALPASAATEAPPTYIECAELLDPAAGKLVGPTTLVVRNGKVDAWLQRRAPKNADRVIVAAGTCAPGFIDLHTHLTSETSPTAYSEAFRLNPADIAYRAQERARRTLVAGFTTVRDLGDTDLVSIALRNAINENRVSGPRIYTAGKSIATTGGHADPTNGRRLDLSGDPGPQDGVINSADEARKAVRQRYKDGSDWIKVTATGGVLSLAKSGMNPQFTAAELKAVVETAHEYGMEVAAHAHGKEGMRRAIEAGVRTIEHGTYMDDEIFALMKQHGTWYVPTLMAGAFVAEKSKEPGYYPEIVRPKAAQIGPLISQTLSNAYRAGVKIAFGTDAGVFPHGRNAQEFGLMVEAGMPEIEALRAATVYAAEVLGESATLGALTPGHYADVVVLDGNPLADIDATGRVRLVIKSGLVEHRRVADRD